MSCKESWQKAKVAELGATAETLMEQELHKLPKNWLIESGVYFEDFGDIDFFIQSPSGLAYTVDVKAHQGKVGWNGASLMRTMYGRPAKFEKDVLRQARGQAYKMARFKKLKFVNPIIAFSNAEVAVSEPFIEGVIVLPQSSLVAYLMQCENQTSAPNNA